MKLKHTCGGPVFGTLAPKGDCARCDELREGAAPRGRYWTKSYERLSTAAIKAHDCKSSRCGPVCTFGDW